MQPLLDKASVRAVATSHQVCPCYLGQELARWADVMVGDHNHDFDLHAQLHAELHAQLHAQSQANQWRAGCWSMRPTN